MKTKRWYEWERWIKFLKIIFPTSGNLLFALEAFIGDFANIIKPVLILYLWLIYRFLFSNVQFSCSVVSRLFATPWIASCQASLSITNSRSLPKLMSFESVMQSSHLILCCPLLLLPPIPPSIRVFSNESTLCMRWPK